MNKINCSEQWLNISVQERDTALLSTIPAGKDHEVGMKAGSPEPHLTFSLWRPPKGLYKS